jgi:hypothetical protein
VHSNLDHLQRALTVSKDKIQAKGIRSVRSRVTNISEHLGEKILVEQTAHSQGQNRSFPIGLVLLPISHEKSSAMVHFAKTFRPS